MAALSAVGIALVTPRAAGRYVTAPLTVRVSATHDAAYRAALDAAAATRKARKDSGAAVRAAQQSATRPSRRAAQAIRQRAWKAEASARHAWQKTLGAVDQAIGENQELAKKAAQASGYALSVSVQARERWEAAANLPNEASPEDFGAAADGARAVLSAARQAHRAAARAAHEAAEASWQAKKRVARPIAG